MPVYYRYLSMLCHLIYQSQVDTLARCWFGCKKGCVPNIILLTHLWNPLALSCSGKYSYFHIYKSRSSIKNPNEILILCQVFQLYFNFVLVKFTYKSICLNVENIKILNSNLLYFVYVILWMCTFYYL